MKFYLILSYIVTYDKEVSKLLGSLFVLVIVICNQNIKIFYKLII